MSSKCVFVQSNIEYTIKVGIFGHLNLNKMMNAIHRKKLSDYPEEWHAKSKIWKQNKL